MISTDQIKTALAKPLPGEKAHKKMLPRGRSLEMSESDLDQTKESAVLLLLFPENEELQLCLMLRPSHMKHHAGQFCFPGGQFEETEKESSAVALRETKEEIGVESDGIEILGNLSDIYVHVSKFFIHPVVGFIQKRPNFKINKDEVEQIIIVPLKHFFNSELISTEIIDTRFGEIEVPCYKIDGNIIWGVTAMIISELIVAIENQTKAG
jgi:8-oxo-dGTP pyrophosphatase MutT (NUDIX family)